MLWEHIFFVVVVLAVVGFCHLLLDTISVPHFTLEMFFFGNFYTFASTMIYLVFPSCNAMEMFSPHEWNRMGGQRERDENEIKIEK